jgi:unspecific monooxygenase
MGLLLLGLPRAGNPLHRDQGFGGNKERLYPSDPSPGMLAAPLRLISGLCLLLATTSIAILFRLSRPPAEPRNIPAVPFWISLQALWKDIDQEDIFKRHIREPLLKHGATKIFFAGQWNILVQRPTLVAQVFKEEDDFQKSGNHQKIPGSVLASYLGENIISSHGEIWKGFRNIMQPGLQERWTIDTMYVNANLLARNLEAAQAVQQSVSVREHLQRLTIANISEIVLGVDFGVSVSPIHMHGGIP